MKVRASEGTDGSKEDIGQRRAKAHRKNQSFGDLNWHLSPRSRMMGDCHVRFCEGFGGEIPPYPLD
ncbi:MAG: hypothetical protein AAFO96_29885 [Bacteroidota bacterium]